MAIGNSVVILLPAILNMQVFLAILVLLAPDRGQARATLAPPAIGAKVADFSLADVDGRVHSLYGFKDKKAIVIVFVGTQCPIANLYVPGLIDLHKKYGEKGVQFLAINSNDQDTLEAVVAHARERKVPFPVLKDVSHKAADALGARRTPEAFVLDAAHTIRYRGRIDDQYNYTSRRPAPAKTELKDAIENLLAGKPVATPESEVQGCVIGRDKEESPKRP
jgi:peroxiredoxin